jgi:hypothetical protein
MDLISFARKYTLFWHFLCYCYRFTTLNGVEVINQTFLSSAISVTDAARLHDPVLDSNIIITLYPYRLTGSQKC